MFPRTGALQEKNENENRNEVDMGEKTPDEREHETLEDIDASTDRDSICKAPGVIEENNGEGGSEKLEKDSVEDNRHRKDDSKKEGGEDPKKIEGESEDNHSNKNDGERDEEEKDDGQRNDGEENENDGEEVDAGKGYDVKGDDCAEERKEGEQGDSGTDEDDGGADESDREEPETWSYRLAAALSNATPRSLAAMKSFWMSPNPLLVIRNDELKSDNGSSLDQASGGHPSIHLGFPLSNSQVEELCNEQLLVSDKNTGLDIIPNKFMVFGNKGFSGWVHQGAEELCKKLGIEGVHIELDFAVVLDGKQQVNGIGSW